MRAGTPGFKGDSGTLQNGRFLELFAVKKT
jgi:hypothetical protein